MYATAMNDSARSDACRDYYYATHQQAAPETASKMNGRLSFAEKRWG
jgi:hypothetical protein